MTTLRAAIQERLDAAGQGHVLAHWDQLDEGGRARLTAQLEALDLDLIAKLGQLLEAGSSSHLPAFSPPVLSSPGRMEPGDLAAARERGEALFAAGQVGYLLVAGGQGSRLGYDGPKGCYRVGPVTDRTLFGWHAARIAKARKRFGQVAPWYVMTSATNDGATRAYFESEDWFGLGQENVKFFEQRMLPALDAQGRILLASPDSLFLAPNGHGGTLEALAHSGLLAEAAERGIEEFSYFQVDTPNARPADTLFLGLHVAAGAEMSSKVVAKQEPGEKVGVLGLADGVLGCIEYSDLPAELRDARDDSGDLTFRAGNIANHVINRAFVERLTSGELQLPWHLARKGIDTIDASGQPTKVDGVKFETFIFDALGEASASVTLEVERIAEFSPIKNATGGSSPQTSRADLAKVFAEWALAAGGEAPPLGPDGYPLIEVAPSYAETEEEFLSRGTPQPNLVGEGHLYE